jgi:ribosomal protein S18 acetylase RimI-like enzyme
MEKLLRIEANELFWLEVSSLPTSISTDSDFTYRFLRPEEVAKIAMDPANQLAVEFADRAFSGRDLCFVASHGDRVASYSWYAPGSIEGRHHVGVAMSYPNDVAYMYNAFTHPDHRGRGLYGHGVALAAKALQDRGVQRLITSVNRSNFASLRSCRRMGFKSLGQMWTFGHGQRRWAIVPSAAKNLGIQFGRTAIVSNRSAAN